MTIRLHATSASASEAVIRNHRVPVDRPLDKGGADTGPMGGELFLASIGGCFMSNLLAAIRARGAEVAEVQTEVTASLEGAPACFSSIELRVFGECKDPELFEKLVEIAGRGCIMVNTLRGKLDLRITIAQRQEIQAAG